MRVNKKVIALLIILALAAGLAPVTLAAGKVSYSDVPSSHWAFDVITKWSAGSYGVLEGNGDGTFSPSNGLSVGELAAILTRTFGYSERASSKVEPSWAAEYVEKAVAAGVIEKAASIDAGAMLTREQAVRYIALAYGVSPVKGSTSFVDDSAIGDAYKPYVNAFQKLGYVIGKGKNDFDPQGRYTRAEAMKVLDNITGEIADTTVSGKSYEKDLIIRKSGVTVEKTTVKGNLIVAQGVGDGEVVLDNVKVEGKLIAYGGGSKSIVIKGASEINTVVLNKGFGEPVHLSVEGDSYVTTCEVAAGSGAIISGSTIMTLSVEANAEVTITEGSVLAKVEINGANVILTIEKDGVITELTISSGGSVDIDGAGTVVTTTTITATTTTRPGNTDPIAPPGPGDDPVVSSTLVESRDSYGRPQDWYYSDTHRSGIVRHRPAETPPLIARFKGNEKGTQLRTTLTGGGAKPYGPNDTGTHMDDPRTIFIDESMVYEDSLTMYPFDLYVNSDTPQAPISNTPAYKVLEQYLTNRGNNIAFGPSVTVEVYRNLETLEAYVVLVIPFFDASSLSLTTPYGELTASGFVPGNDVNETYPASATVTGVMSSSTVTIATIGGKDYDLALNSAYSPTVDRLDFRNSYTFYMDKDGVIVGAVLDGAYTAPLYGFLVDSDNLEWQSNGTAKAPFILSTGEFTNIIISEQTVSGLRIRDTRFYQLDPGARPGEYDAIPLDQASSRVTYCLVEEARLGSVEFELTNINGGNQTPNFKQFDYSPSGTNTIYVHGDYSTPSDVYGEKMSDLQDAIEESIKTDYSVGIIFVIENEYRSNEADTIFVVNWQADKVAYGTGLLGW